MPPSDDEYKPGPHTRLLFRSEKQLSFTPKKYYRIIEDSAVIEKMRAWVPEERERAQGWEYDEDSGRTILVEMDAQ